MPEEAASASTAPPSGGRPATELREIADAVRNRVDLFGKTLAGIAALATGAAGLNKIGDLIPVGDNAFSAIVAIFALAATAGAAIVVAVRLMNVGRPVFLKGDLPNEGELDEQEREAVRPVFDDAAKRFGYSSLIGLQQRERSLRSAASRATDADERARRTALADQAKEEIEQALARGQVVVVRRRAARVVSDGWACTCYAVVIAGLIAFAVCTDIVSSNRKDPVADAKACGEARKAGATGNEMGKTDKKCDAVGENGPEDETKPPSAVEARAQITEKLAAASSACSALVHKKGDATSGPLKEADCNPVRTAVAGMNSPTP